MKYRIVAAALLLAACSSEPRISLGTTVPQDKGLRVLQDDTRYYLTRNQDYFYEVKRDEFSPAPIRKLDIELAKVLPGDVDRNSIRIKKMAIYFGYSSQDVAARRRATIAGGIGGVVGAAVAGSIPSGALAKPGTTDNQTLGCDFLARSNGRIIEFYISEPACNDAFPCFKHGLGGNKPDGDPAIRATAGRVAQMCVAKASAMILEYQKLPPLAEKDQELR
jgi:hypothetical protein